MRLYQGLSSDDYIVIKLDGEKIFEGKANTAPKTYGQAIVRYSYPISETCWFYEI